MSLPDVFPAARRAQVPVSIKVAMIVLAAVVVCAFAARWIAPQDPYVQHLDIGISLPSDTFLAGTDTLGRDILSRVITGAATALMGPMVIAAGAFCLATALGLMAGFYGGWVDAAIMRWADFMLALPYTLITIVVVGVIGGGYWTAVFVLLILFVPSDTRIVRAAVLEQRPRPYIEAARVLGIPQSRILIVHILPNVLPIILAYVAIDFAFALVNLAGLSFLGLGVEPGTADWGRMLSENRNLIASNPPGVLLPAGMIIVTAVCMNLIGDWLFERFTK